MKRLFYTFSCTLLCTFCGPYVNEASAQSKEAELRSTTHQERAERRAERLAEYEKFIDSLVLSHIFEFNPQSVQLQPAGPLKLLMNANYTLTIWRGSLDICLPYYIGVVPPYRFVLLNTGSPTLRNYITEQTEHGWKVSFNAALYADSDYSFILDIDPHGNANLTINNPWYNPVQYMGTITQIY